MRHQKGDRVRHPRKPDWGMGEVLDDSDGREVRIFFENAGARTLSLAYVDLEDISGNDAQSAHLDNLKLSPSSGGIEYQSLPDSIAFFRSEFSGGFHGDVYDEHERAYKVKTHELAREVLASEALQALLEKEDHAEVCRRALKVLNASNLVSPFEKMALKDGLAGEAAERRFAAGLQELLYGDRALQPRFEAFASLLQDLDAGKWTLLTYYLYIVPPERYMFVKPTVLQHAADLCRFEIQYRPEPNWLTYRRILDFSEYLREQIEELEPRDMIDVQSFMWVIAPGSYR